MPLHPPLPIPERILAFGPAGSGKTTNWLDIARWYTKTNAPGTFWVCDTDFAVERMLISYPEIVPRLNVYSCYDWPDYMTFQRDVLAKATKDDWVIADFIGNAWQAVQAAYTEEVFNKDIADYFLQARKELKSGAKSLSALDGWVDWQVINPMYRRWINPLLFKGRYHIYATAKGEALSSDKKPTEDAQTRQLLLPYGSKPVGQKDLTFQFHTVLLTARTETTRTITAGTATTRTITAIKDREREEVKGRQVNSFTVDYLVKVAGWKP